VGAVLWVDFPYNPLGNPQELVGLLVGASAALAVFVRYGYIYAALGAMVCAGLAPFQLFYADSVERLLAGCAFLGFLIWSRRKRREHGDDFPGDDHGLLQAAAWIGVYAALNLRLDLGWSGHSHPSWFYWLTYAAIWIIPGSGVALAVRERDRPLLDANLALLLVTLVTNKPYLGVERKPWDPILLGVFLMGAAVGIRRWLANGDGESRAGITPRRILRAQKELPAAAGLAAAAFDPRPGPRQIEQRDDPFQGQGGRSGGGGAGGSY
jgi:hypothetical protein